MIFRYIRNQSSFEDHNWPISQNYYIETLFLGFTIETMIVENSTHQLNQSHHQILDLSWSLKDLHLYDNQSNPFVASVFTISAGLTFVLGGIVHRAIFKLLNRLPNRPINSILYPTLVSHLLQEAV